MATFIKEYIITSGYVSAESMDTGSSTPGAAILTLRHTGKDSRRVLRVANANTASITVTVAEGSGPRAALKAKDIAVGAGKTIYIALFDSARFKDLGLGYVTVILKDAGGTANLDETERANVQIEAVQL